MFEASFFEVTPPGSATAQEHCATRSKHAAYDTVLPVSDLVKVPASPFKAPQSQYAAHPIVGRRPMKTTTQDVKMSEVIWIPTRIWSRQKIVRLHILVRHHRVRFFFRVWQSFHGNLVCRQYDCFQKTKALALLSFAAHARVTRGLLPKVWFSMHCQEHNVLFLCSYCRYCLTAVLSCTTARIYHAQRRGVSPAVE